MLILEYPLRLKRDDNRTISITFPDFPEAHTFRRTKDEALARAGDALVSVVDDYIRDRRPIPVPSAGKLTVTLPALITIKIALYQAMREQDVGKADLARLLDWHLPQVDRLLDLRHSSRLDQLEAAFRVLGQRLVVASAPVNGEPSAIAVARRLPRRGKRDPRRRPTGR